METENLNLKLESNLPWQISMLKVQGDRIIEQRDYYVKWYRDIKVSATAAQITGFSMPKYLATCVDYQKVIPEIIDWTSQSDYVIGHNILGFDLLLLKQIYDINKKDFSHILSKAIDTHALIKGIKLNERFDHAQNDLISYQYRMINRMAKGVKTNMMTVGKEYGIEHDYETLHDALSDLELNLKIWNKIKWQIDI
jgi:DNA polymerase III epsilon subunit-like protein